MEPDMTSYPVPREMKGGKRTGTSKVRLNTVPLTIDDQDRQRHQETSNDQHKSEILPSSVYKPPIQAADQRPRNPYHGEISCNPRKARTSAQIFKPLPGEPEELTPLDHRIAIQGGTTSNIDYLPNRLKIHKTRISKSPSEEIWELTQENGYLREELAYYKRAFKSTHDFKEEVSRAHRLLQQALQTMSRRAKDSEGQLLQYWGIHWDDGNEEIKVF